MNREPTVFRSGRLVEEKHLISKGTLQAQESVSTPASDEWQLIEGYPQSGIEMRFSKGKKYYRATAMIDDERYEGERGPVYSKEYRACDEADAQRVDGNAHINPFAAQYEQDIAAAVARSHMKPDQAAMSDMLAVLKTLTNDLMFPYNRWMQRRERHAAQMSRTASIREQVALMAADIEEFGMEPEYEQFVEQLQTLLKKGKN